MFVSIWDTSTGFLGEIRSQEIDVLSVALSPNGKVLVTKTSEKDNKLTLWDVTQQTTIGKKLYGHNSNISRVIFSPNGKFLVSGDVNGLVMLWDIKLQSWLKKMCHIAGRNLSHEEWKQFIGNAIPYQKTCPEFPVNEF
jgi:WD40 repeat protein